MLSDEEFAIAKDLAVMLNDGLSGIPTHIKLLGLAMYMAADISAPAKSRQEADRAVDAFADMVKSEIASMMDQRRKG